MAEGCISSLEPVCGYLGAHTHKLPETTPTDSSNCDGRTMRATHNATNDYEVARSCMNWASGIGLSGPPEEGPSLYLISSLVLRSCPIRRPAETFRNCIRHLKANLSSRVT
jgi:hypothetical protein